MVLKFRLDPEKHITALILVPLLVALAVLLIAGMFAVDRMHNSGVTQELDQMHISVHAMFQKQIEGDAGQLSATLEATMTDRLLLDMVARGDREALLKHAMPFYKILNSRYDVTHFYFSDANRVNILRLHQPERFGDIINRHTTLEAEKKGEISWGIELGPMGLFTLRVVKPLYKSGKLVGFAELGREIGHVTPRIKSVLNVDIYRTINKQYIVRENWEKGMKLLGREAIWGRFRDVVLIDSTAPLDSSMQEFIDKFQGKNSGRVMDAKRFQAFDILPLRDASGRSVGNLIMRINFQEMYRQAHRLEIIVLLLGIGLGLILLALFYLLLSRLQNELSGSREALVLESQRREAQQELHLHEMEVRRIEMEEQASFLDTVIHNAGDGIITIDGSGLVLSFNRAAENIFGYSRDEMIGRNFSLLISPTDSGPNDGSPENHPNKSVEDIVGAGRDVHGLRNDGTGVPVYLAVSEVLKSDGSRVFVAVIHDISDRERTKQAMLERNLALERSNKELESFAYVASHDLQEPLRKVQAFGERLGRIAAGNLGEQGMDYLERIRNAASRMQMLINDLLQFSRVTTRALPFEPVDLKAIAESVICDLEVALEEKGGRVGVEELPRIEADPMQMRQLFQNLIGNSLKYIRPGVPPVITVKQAPTEFDHERVTIAFTDNGLGFDMKYAERIFGLFQRLHGKNEFAGSGVGLALCRKIVERHGGEIRAESAPGEGSTFFVTLPIHPKADPLAAPAAVKEGS